jgi:hypothetical protein
VSVADAAGEHGARALQPVWTASALSPRHYHPMPEGRQPYQGSGECE